MISRLAKQTVEKWQGEGLKPTFEDVVRLNELGLRIERDSSAFEVASVPRCSFLGDDVLWEPTIGKRIWLEQAQRLVREDYESQLYLVAFALNCPDRELPDLSSLKELKKAVVKFRDEVLIHFTERQIMTAVDIALRGESPDLDPADAKAATEIPSETRSVYRQLFDQAMGYGISEGVKWEATPDELERMMILAALRDGADVLKGEHAQNAGRFYAEAGRIHERLKGEVKDGEE